MLSRSIPLTPFPECSQLFFYTSKSPWCDFILLIGSWWDPYFMAWVVKLSTANNQDQLVITELPNTFVLDRFHPKLRSGNTTISSQSSVRTQWGERTQKLKSTAATSGCWMLFIRPPVVVAFVVCSLLIQTAYLHDHLTMAWLYISVFFVK